MCQPCLALLPENEEQCLQQDWAACGLVAAGGGGGGGHCFPASDRGKVLLGIACCAVLLCLFSSTWWGCVPVASNPPLPACPLQGAWSLQGLAAHGADGLRCARLQTRARLYWIWL